MITLKEALLNWLDRSDKLTDEECDVKTKVDVNGKYIRTPYKLCEEIIYQISTDRNWWADQKILVVDTIEDIPVLLTVGAKSCNITYIAPYVFKSKFVSRIGCKVIQENFLTWKKDMHFDVIIGNPPYQSSREGTTASEDLASKFVHKNISLDSNYLALIIPSDWAGPNNSKLKNTLFNSNKLSKLCLYGDKWFNVAKNTCCIFYNKLNTNYTEIIDIHGSSLKIPLKNVNSISLENKLTSFLLRFKGHSSYLDSRWTHGNLYLNKLNSIVGNDLEFIQAVGRKNEPLSTTMIKAGIESTGFGKSKIVLPTVGDAGKIGQIKIATKSQVGGHSVVFLITDNDIESQNLKSYLETKVVKLLIKSVKKSTPNSKGTFSCIPNVDLSCNWTDEKLYKYFGLTQDEINYIEEIIK